jgi:hypothetical protein
MEDVYISILLCWRRPGWLGGEFEQFYGRAVFNYERDADAVGWAVGRNQDFAASKLGGEISHFKRDVRNLPDEIRDRRVRFETHPLHAKFAFLVADDKEFQVFQVGLARPRFSSGKLKTRGTDGATETVEDFAVTAEAFCHGSGKASRSE